MRHLLTVIIVFVISTIIYLTVDWNSLNLSLSNHSETDKHADNLFETDLTVNDDIDIAENAELWLDTIMSAKGHSFGYSGDVSMWGGWYYDSVFVGDDIMLQYDSVAPSTLKLNLFTRDLIVDLGDDQALDKIKNFMNPIDGFMRYQKSYEKCLDSVMDETYGLIKYMGGFSFTADYADSCLEHADVISRFICYLSSVSENEKAQVPSLSAFYAGYNPTKYYRAVYTGNPHNLSELSDFLANKTFENWIRGGDLDFGSSEATLEIRSHIVNPRFATFSKYEYDREGIGHGMYTATFHTLDLKSGKEIENKDLFRANKIEKVKSLLFEVMATDTHYLAWHPGVQSASDILPLIKSWQSADPLLDGTEFEETKKDFTFTLPQGALTDSGVIFSFQPYEIDCWSAGAYHFIVPYNKLMPYLTTKVKELIN